MISIRTASQDDAIFISLLGRITFNETFGDLFKDNGDLPNYLNRTFSVSKIKKSLNNENNQFYLAFVDDLPVGYAKLKLNSASEFIDSKKISQLQKIYVLKDFLSMKIGHQLQSLLLDRAKVLGSKSIWLSVYKENERAIAFYKKNQFAEVGSHNFSIGSHDFIFSVMEKKF